MYVIITTNMGLTAPSSTQDIYSTQVNANNLAILDYHDHSPGRGSQLTGNSILPGSLVASNVSPIVSANIANIMQGQASFVGIQAGSATVTWAGSTTSGSIAVTFNTAYPTSTLVSIILTPVNGSTTFIPSYSSLTVTGFTIDLTAGTAPASSTTTVVSWVAIPHTQ